MELWCLLPQLVTRIMLMLTSRDSLQSLCIAHESRHEELSDSLG